MSLNAGDWKLGQQNLITFPMVNSVTGANLPGLGGAYTLQLSKAGGAFAPSAGVKAEIGNGVYSYLSTAAEADTRGPVALYITGVGAVEQNLEYVVEDRVINAIEFTYTVTNDTTLLPEEGVQVWFTLDVAGTNVVWAGVTDAFGVARDTDGELPFLDPGTYYVWRQKAGFSAVNPDIEVVS